MLWKQDENNLLQTATSNRNRRRPSGVYMFLTKSHFCTKQVWPKRRQFSKEPRKQKSWDTLRILGPHYYKKSAGSLLQKKEKKCKNKKSKSGSVVKLTSRVFFFSSSPRRSALLPCCGCPQFYFIFFQKAKSWFSLSFFPIRFGCKTIFYDSQIQKILKKKVLSTGPKRE